MKPIWHKSFRIPLPYSSLALKFANSLRIMTAYFLISSTVLLAVKRLIRFLIKDLNSSIDSFLKYTSNPIRIFISLIFSFSIISLSIILTVKDYNLSHIFSVLSKSKGVNKDCIIIMPLSHNFKSNNYILRLSLNLVNLVSLS